MLDRENPSSIRACLGAARENARSLRPLISTEMWAQLNTFYRQFGTLTEANISEHRLAGLCSWIKLGCQTYHGVTEGTFYRDAGWFFYLIGKNLERADQMTRLIDVKYHLLLPRTVDVGSAIDVSQWMAVLRSAAGYHAYRRIHPRGMSAMQVAGFLLLNDQFPRSTRSCIDAVANALDRLGQIGVVTPENSIQSLAELRADFQRQSIKDIVGRGLHEYLDGVQLRLIKLADELGHSFFGYDYPQPGQTQLQRIRQLEPPKSWPANPPGLSQGQAAGNSGSTAAGPSPISWPSARTAAASPISSSPKIPSITKMPPSPACSR